MIAHYYIYVKSWSRPRESNPEPLLYESIALPVELGRQAGDGNRTRVSTLGRSHTAIVLHPPKLFIPSTKKIMPPLFIVWHIFNTARYFILIG